MAAVLKQGIRLLAQPELMTKWTALLSLLNGAGSEKVVLFAQPVETVGVVTRLLEERYGVSARYARGRHVSDRARKASHDRDAYG